MTLIHTLDMNFLGFPQAIAVYLIPHAHGAVLVESGPGSTQAALQAGLAAHGFTPADVTDVLLTHIHLDHAGASGWLAQHGARIHVHPVGAPHMIDPTKLLTSAGRIYGDQMERLWGEFLPVPEERLSLVQDGEVIEIGALRFRALDTPGHAYHHYAYIFENGAARDAADNGVADNVCFTGDVGGVRLPGPPHLRLPMPPPEFHLETWRSSIQRLGQEYDNGAFRRIAPTHFGIFDDPGWHLKAVADSLGEVEQWMSAVMPGDPPLDELNRQFLAWTEERSHDLGLSEQDLQTYEAANPSWMSSQGIQRYWRKYRQE